MAISRELHYLDICDTVAANSKCLSRRVGAIIVKDKTIIGTGYNGPPRGFPHCNERLRLDEDFRESYEKQLSIDGGSPFIDTNTANTVCPRRLLGHGSGEGLEHCVAGHAERNCIVNSARMGICTMGAIMYMNCGVPCSQCLVEIINAGIEEIVVTSKSFYDISAKYLIGYSKLKVRTYDD